MEEATGPPTEIWPDTLEPFRVFCAIETQWLWTGGGGDAFRTGLNYCALPEVWRRTKVPIDRRDIVFEHLQTMEREALAIFAMRMKKN